MANPVIDPWLRIVHSTGAEISVTLLVSGRVVTGMLTPMQRWDVWEREVFRRTLLEEGGQFRLPSQEVDPPSEELVERVKSEWESLEAEFYDDSSDTQGFAIAYLRNATVHSAVRGSHELRMPMLMVHVHSIAACTPGIFSVQDAR